jgi:hypothetical protein
VAASAHSKDYLRTKKEKLGHLFTEAQSREKQS